MGMGASLKLVGGNENFEGSKVRREGREISVPKIEGSKVRMEGA